MKTVVICSSATFYKHANELKDMLEKQGVHAVVPNTAEKMAEANDYDVSHYKTWFGNANDYHKKSEFMRAHFDKITAGHAVLVVNDEKHGVQNYIGPNVLMEMSLAWYQGKAVYIFNGLPQESPFEEEIMGFQPIVLRGNLNKLISDFAEK